MPALQNSSPFTCTSAPLPSVDADLLIVPWFEGEDPSSPGSIAGLPPVPGINDAVGGEIGRALASKEFAARAYDIFITPIIDRTWRARRLALVGAGPVATFDTSMSRRLATAAGLAARQRRVERIAFVLRPGRAEVSGDIDVAGFLQAVNEGLTLAEFDSGAYKTDEASARAAQLALCTIVLPDMPDSSPESKVRLDGAARRGRLLGECSNLARGLANEPGNTLTPREFAARASEIVGGSGASVEILDEQQIEALGMGMLLGVARGSTEPPRLMVFKHEPAHNIRGPVLGLVGKGVTFDTGGISIKPAENMDRMKDDMAGGAAVICAMRAIAMLGAPIRVIGVVPATENMPGGRAIKPGDILKSAEGKTVEVLNTDAEGRLILGDGLWYARKLGATHLVDVATLTAAVVIALGKLISGIFGTPDSWVKQIRKVAERAGDRVWQLPLVEEYREQLKSEIADFSNVGGRPASSITAALFLKEFTGGLPWAHLDIAGTAWAEDAKPYQPKGPTGVAVRTLAELAFTLDQG
jgi:leucyl aminopeptidase